VRARALGSSASRAFVRTTHAVDGRPSCVARPSSYGRRGLLATLLILSSWRAEARAAESLPTRIAYARALALAAEVAPDLSIARGREALARTEVGVARTVPNPSLAAGTNTQAARVSVTASFPLVILGQRGAASAAARADVDTVVMDTAAVRSDVRASAAHAYVGLWSAEGRMTARREAAVIATRVDDAVAGRVELGAAPEVDGLRAHGERLRADADAREAEDLVAAAGAALGRWIGVEEELRAADAPFVPSVLPALAELESRVSGGPAVRREELDARAAEARAARERASVRPTLVFDLGLDAYDPTLPATNYRAQLGAEVPLLNQRGAYVQREQQAAALARSRMIAARVRLSAELRVAYRTCQAWTARERALRDGVLPAAVAAARATEESYGLGRAPLVSVLDAERALVDTQLTLLEASSGRADAWIEVEHAMGLR
jgi:outer membrane protein TolC